MASPLQIGITGGIGSGKSLVCKIFACLGVPIYDADSHAKELMTTDGILVSQIKKEFGDLSYHGDGTLNRTHLGKTAFSNPEKLAALNALVHPRVAFHYAAWVAQQQHQPYVIKEAALLYEAGSYAALDKIIVVHAPERIRIERVRARDKHRTDAQIREIIEKQMPEDEKVKRADFVLLNDESLLLIPQVLALHQRFIASS